MQFSAPPPPPSFQHPVHTSTLNVRSSLSVTDKAARSHETVVVLVFVTLLSSRTGRELRLAQPDIPTRRRKQRVPFEVLVAVRHSTRCHVPAARDVCTARSDNVKAAMHSELLQRTDASVRSEFP
jgi:hypothetical protein